MTFHLHVLKGCSPAPLANYLKALGVLRVVGEQADSQVRGWWEGERFCLLSTLSKEELESFFLTRYEPTPVFNPWGGRSGFYSGSSEKTARNALAAIECSTSSRLASYRQAICVIRNVIRELGGKKPVDELSRSLMIAKIRSQIRNGGLEWLDTVLADLGGSFRGPAIFGTGGNEGSGSYTAAFLAAVVECILRPEWNHYITSSLWLADAERDSWDGRFQPPPSEAIKKPKTESVAGPFRQFMPSGQGSPWDLLFAFEGAIVVQSGVVRRSSSVVNRFLSSPFYFAPLGIGTGASSEMDEFILNKGKKNPGRGEQWFPLWSKPSTFKETKMVIREGRLLCGRQAARNPIDAGRAICALGSTRGIHAFLRYGYLQRDNLATHFAVPLGRILVHEKTTARVVDDISDWLDRLHRVARSRSAPSRVVAAERRLANAVFAALTHDDTPARWQAVLLAAADIERLQATGTGVEAGPIPPLRPEWVAAAAADSPEFRLALSLGSAAASYFDGKPTDPLRHHFLPLEPGARRFKTTEKRLVNDPRVVVSGRDVLRDLASIVERRLIESSQKGQRRSRLVPAAGCGARLADLARFLNGLVDVERVFNLARAFMAIKWDQWSWDKRPSTPLAKDLPEEIWLALRLCCAPWPLGGDRDIPADERIVRLMEAGDVGRAIDIARQRLLSAGIRPPVYAATTDPVSARRWAAALVFPIYRNTALEACAVIDPSMKGHIHA